MTSHRLQPRPDRPDVDVAFLSWSAHLGSFVMRAYGTGGSLLLYKDNRRGEVVELDRAIALIEPFAVIPREVRDELGRAQRDNPPSGGGQAANASEAMG